SLICVLVALGSAPLNSTLREHSESFRRGAIACVPFPRTAECRSWPSRFGFGLVQRYMQPESTAIPGTFHTDREGNEPQHRWTSSDQAVHPLHHRRAVRSAAPSGASVARAHARLSATDHSDSRHFPP